MLRDHAQNKLRLVQLQIENLDLKAEVARLRKPTRPRDNYRLLPLFVGSAPAIADYVWIQPTGCGPWMLFGEAVGPNCLARLVAMLYELRINDPDDVLEVRIIRLTLDQFVANNGEMAKMVLYPGDAISFSREAPVNPRGDVLRRQNDYCVLHKCGVQS